LKKINKNKIYSWTLLLAGGLNLFCSEILMAKAVPSSTFVGNGGDAQDLDLGVTLAVISNVSQSLDAGSKDTLCKCSDEWQENDICRVLRQLSSQEVKACQQILLTYGQQLSELAGRKSPVVYDWSYSDMSVRSQAQSQRGRPVDAVTQPQKKRIIINRSRFQAMPPSYRVALITHELFHLIPFEKGLLTDEEPAPPFASGRAMLNALGAAIAMEANERQVFKDFNELRDVSRAGKVHRLYLEGRNIRHPEKSANSLLKSTNSGGTALGYIYQPGSLGLNISVETTGYSGSAFGIGISEKQAIYQLGVQYRFFPWNGYLSRWNELYVTTGFNAGFGTSYYKASSKYVDKSDKGSLLSIGGAAKMFIPLNRDLWITVGSEFRQLRYEYKTLRIKTIENQVVNTIGGAYGF
jgi:hypothetical protein